MNITIEMSTLEETSSLIIRNTWAKSNYVTLEFEGKTCTVNANDLISAVEKAKLNCFGR